MAESAAQPELVASYFTLSGAGFGEPPRNTFVERCQAAAAAGFAGIGLHVDELERTVTAGLDTDGMRAVLADTGLRLVEIEFLSGWGVRRRRGGARAYRGQGVRGRGRVRRRHVSAEEFPRRRRGRRVRPGRGRAAPRRLSARAAQRDLLVAVGPFPWAALPDVGTAVELLRRAGAPNAGLRVDAWHYFNRGANLDAARVVLHRAHTGGELPRRVC